MHLGSLNHYFDMTSQCMPGYRKIKSNRNTCIRIDPNAACVFEYK